MTEYIDEDEYYDNNAPVVYDYGEYDEYPYQANAMSSTRLTEAMRNNLSFLRDAINKGDLNSMQDLYENSLTKLMDQYQNPLPPPDSEEMQQILEKDELFLIIYKELYYRQIYANGKPLLDDRFNSYYNYVDFFNYILSSNEPVTLELPNQWLWEIMDDFVYQFQSYCVYISNVDKMSPGDQNRCLSQLKMWNVHSVLNVLHSLVQKSNINQQLEVYSKGGNPEEVAGEFGRRPLYKMLGYFALIALLRLHSQLGDYYQAIKVLQHLELNRKGLSRVPSCQVSTYYYVGFAYMMMRRYEDAIRTFVNVLVYIMRTKASFHSRSYQLKQINKQMDKMYALLSICMALHPQRIDESVLQLLKSKQAANLQAMQSGDLDTFESQFYFGCPRFLSPVNPLVHGLQTMDPKIAQLSKQPQLQQWNAFRGEIEAQLQIPTIRSFLKLYTTMPVEKLAKFLPQPLDMAKDGQPIPEQELLKHFHRKLMSFKHLMSNMVCTGGGSLDGEFQTGSDMDFFIDKDMIHIADTKIARRYGEYFIRQYHKVEEAFETAKRIQL
ncbi:eukaryotic translation initiation factor 3 subunit L [Galendromus occidentalis]|uniref:Eukaryotic translation initiation factor 3 subunit L n=1 Tax=Galendromus occidentalis TaxID=34638 RepID=A0AAJ6QYT3_9ACAR|nr:eukaryotic translation initiation factor 3 subunit L [Galendromus occidentalis]